MDMDKRFKNVFEESANDGIWQPNGRVVTQYKGRHYYATDRLREGVNIYDLEVNMGTSIQYIQSTSSKMTSLMKSEELIAGQGIYKVNAEKSKRKKEAETAIKKALNE